MGHERRKRMTNLNLLYDNFLWFHFLVAKTNHRMQAAAQLQLAMLLTEECKWRGLNSTKVRLVCT